MSHIRKIDEMAGGKKTYQVECTIIYNGMTTVEAANENEALRIVSDDLKERNLREFPDNVMVGDISFSFGEATADYAYEEDM